MYRTFYKWDLSKGSSAPESMSSSRALPILGVGGEGGLVDYVALELCRLCCPCLFFLETQSNADKLAGRGQKNISSCWSQRSPLVSPHLGCRGLGNHGDGVSPGLRAARDGQRIWRGRHRRQTLVVLVNSASATVNALPTPSRRRSQCRWPDMCWVSEKVPKEVWDLFTL